MRSHISTRLLAVVGIVVSGAWAYAQPELTLVGENFSISDPGVPNVSAVSTAFNTEKNEYRVIWADSRLGVEPDIFARRVSTAGIVGPTVPIITTEWTHIDPRLAYNPSQDNYLASWRYQGMESGTPGFNHSFGALVSSDSGMQTAALDLCHAGLEPASVYNSVSDEFLLCARSFGATGGSAGIFAQRVASDGSKIGGPITVATDGAPAPGGAVAFNPNANQYLITWRDQEASKLKGRLMNANGTFATAAFPISGLFPASELAADVRYDAVNDRYLAVFGVFMGGPVYGQFISATGTLLGSALTIAAHADVSPTLAFDPVNHVFAVVFFNGASNSIAVQALDADGALLGGPLPIVSGSVWVTGVQVVTANQNGGGFLVTWTDGRAGGGQVDVYGQLVDVVGLWGVGDLNCDGLLNAFDIDPFVMAITDVAGYTAAFPDCDYMLADVNGDGAVNAFDIDPFVLLLTGG